MNLVNKNSGRAVHPPEPKPAEATELNGPGIDIFNWFCFGSVPNFLKPKGLVQASGYVV